MHSLSKFKSTLKALPIFLVFCSVQAEEFSDEHILPGVTALEFTPDAVLTSMTPGRVSDRRVRYFVAARGEYVFNEVSETAFNEYPRADSHQRQFDGFDYASAGVERYELAHRGIIVERSFSGCPAGTTGEHRIVHSQFELTVDLICGPRIRDALVANDKLWLLQYGEPYDDAQIEKSVVISSLCGEVENRFDIGHHPPFGFALDPWTGDVWAVSQERLTVFSGNLEFVRQYWPVHAFDPGTGQPGVFVNESETPLVSDPLAVIAFGFDEDFRAEFYELTSTLPDFRGSSLLYNYRMNGPDWTHSPQLPSSLGVLLEHAKPTSAWRRLLCLVDDPRAKELCSLDPDDWPEQASP